MSFDRLFESREHTAQLLEAVELYHAAAAVYAENGQMPLAEMCLMKANISVSRSSANVRKIAFRDVRVAEFKAQGGSHHARG